MRPFEPLATALAPSRKENEDGHGPKRRRTSSRIAITDATERACLHWLHARCAPLQFPKSTGEPPLLTGTSSSSSKASGCPAGSVASMGSPHIQHGSPSARTRRTSASRPERRRGFRFDTSHPPSSRASCAAYMYHTRCGAGRCRMLLVDANSRERTKIGPQPEGHGPSNHAASPTPSIAMRDGAMSIASSRVYSLP